MDAWGALSRLWEDEHMWEKHHTREETHEVQLCHFIVLCATFVLPGNLLHLLQRQFQRR